MLLIKQKNSNLAFTSRTLSLLHVAFELKSEKLMDKAKKNPKKGKSKSSFGYTCAKGK